MKIDTLDGVDLAGLAMVVGFVLIVLGCIVGAVRDDSERHQERMACIAAGHVPAECERKQDEISVHLSLGSAGRIAR